VELDIVQDADRLDALEPSTGRMFTMEDLKQSAIRPNIVEVKMTKEEYKE
jgi:hypothetical protein